MQMMRDGNAFAQAASVYDEGLRAYMLKVYNYMAGALALSGIVAFLTSQNEALMQTLFGTPLMWVVVLAPLALVFFFSFKINSLSVQAAQGLFWTYAGLMGLSMATIFVIYTGASVARVFLITASVFGAMSLYGYTTKRDLTGFGSFLFMGLIGIILASLVNIFLKSTGLEFAISILGVLIFTGLTAYDTQKIRQMYDVAGNQEVAQKMAIMGALTLYLDFINLFMMLLRFFGDRR